MTVRTFHDLGRTQAGRTKQLTRAFNGMADEMKLKQSVAIEEVPMTIQQYECLVADLREKLQAAEDLIADMRAQANSDAPAAAPTSTKYWDSKRVAKESHVAVCTICRNADTLGGIKLGGDWLFPAGTTYGKKRGK